MLLRGAIPMCHDGSSSSAAMPAAKPKSRPKVKPVPKAKTAQQEATKADVLLSIPQPCSAKHKSLIANQTCQVMKDASTAILECKSWKSKLEAANTQGPQHIILLFMFFLLLVTSGCGDSQSSINLHPEAYEHVAGLGG